MANESLSNVKGLMQNKTTRVVVILTFGVIAAALIYSNMTTSNQASRPKELQATVGAPTMPNVSSTPGTSDNPLHNEKIIELNKREAEAAINNGTSALPRLSKPAVGADGDLFNLVAKKPDGTAKPADPTVPAPNAPRAPVNPAMPTPGSAPVVAQPQVAKSSQLKDSERDMAAAMAGMLNSWTPSPQRLEVEYVATKQNGAGAGSGVVSGQMASGPGVMPMQAVASQESSGSTSASKKVAIKAGSILHAVVITSVNSDEPGPVLAQITTGPYSGGRLIGKFELPKDAEKMILTFTTLSMQNADKSYDLSAYAVDPQTARTALGSDVDHHYLARYGAFTAAAFLKGYSQALSQQGSTQTISSGAGGVSATTTYPQMSTKDLAISALGSVGGEVASNLKGDLKRPPTITLNSGTEIGLLVMKDTSF
jgi:type IV secretory pathway VirB10-like protein